MPCRSPGGMTVVRAFGPASSSIRFCVNCEFAILTRAARRMPRITRRSTRYFFMTLMSSPWTFTTRGTRHNLQSTHPANPSGIGRAHSTTSKRMSTRSFRPARTNLKASLSHSKPEMPRCGKSIRVTRYRTVESNCSDPSIRRVMTLTSSSVQSTNRALNLFAVPPSNGG